MLEEIKDCVAKGDVELSVEEVYQNINTKFGPGWAKSGAQNFNFQQTMQADPKTFPWPFFPDGYSVDTVM